MMRGAYFYVHIHKSTDFIRKFQLNVEIKLDFRYSYG